MDISLDYKTPETIKVFGSMKKLINKKKNAENVPSLEVDNQYQ